MSTKLIVVPLLLSGMMLASCAKEAAPEPKKPADTSKPAPAPAPAPAPEKK
jgi:hypothetical protein